MYNYQKAGSRQCILWQKEYMSDVCIKIKNFDNCLNLCENHTFLKDLFFSDTFTNLFDVSNLIDDIEIFVKNSGKSCETFQKNKWVPCKSDCYTLIHNMVMKEINSTAYMLRLMSNSLLKISDEFSFYFEYDGELLTGLWENDKNRFNIKTNDNSKPRTILGFGPSASGKTYWANNIIKMFNEQFSGNFPKIFMSVDGGICREMSEVYQTVINKVENSSLGGLTNLVTAGLGRTKTIFKSGTIKKTLNKYLIEQKKSGNRISIYAPITLGGCIRSLCKKDYKAFLDITDDKNWIGLMIYQHKSGLECPYKNKYRCVGCTESGKMRELGEGKKYSSGAYHNSIRNGFIAIKNSKFCRLLIHNSGGYKYKSKSGETLFSKSIITEYPINGEFKFDKIDKKYNSVFIQQGIEKCI